MVQPDSHARARESVLHCPAHALQQAVPSVARQLPETAMEAEARTAYSVCWRMSPLTPAPGCRRRSRERRRHAVARRFPPSRHIVRPATSHSVPFRRTPTGKHAAAAAPSCWPPFMSASSETRFSEAPPRRQNGRQSRWQPAEGKERSERQPAVARSAPELLF